MMLKVDFNSYYRLSLKKIVGICVSYLKQKSKDRNLVDWKNKNRNVKCGVQSKNFNFYCQLIFFHNIVKVKIPLFFCGKPCILTKTATLPVFTHPKHNFFRLSDNCQKYR